MLRSQSQRGTSTRLHNQPMHQNKGPRNWRPISMHQSGSCRKQVVPSKVSLRGFNEAALYGDVGRVKGASPGCRYTQILAAVGSLLPAWRDQGGELVQDLNIPAEGMTQEGMQTLPKPWLTGWKSTSCHVSHWLSLPGKPEGTEPRRERPPASASRCAEQVERGGQPIRGRNAV